MNRSIRVAALTFACLLVAASSSAQTRSMTEQETPSRTPAPGAAGAQAQGSAAEAEAAEEDAEASATQAEAAAAAATAADLDEQALDAETEEQIRLLEEEIRQRRQEAATALGAAQQATEAASTSKQQAKDAADAAVEAEKAARHAECQLKRLQGLECTNPADEGVWVGYLDIGGSFSLNSTANVPGEARGTSVNGNAKISGVLDFLKGKHEWRNSLQWDIGATRAASDQVWVKSIDRFNLATGHYYNVTKWFGTFLELELQTNFFPLDIRRGEDVVFCDGKFDSGAGTCAGGPLDATNSAYLGTTDSFSATSAFEPVTLDERGGVFFQLFNKTYFRWIARAGIGAQQFFVSDNAYYEKGRGDGYVELGLLDRYGLFGVMADTEMMGAVNDGMVQYGASAGVLYPFIDTNSDKTDDLDITPLQVDLGAFVNFTIAEWLGFRVSGEAYRQPQVTADKWQTRINFLATFSYSIFGDRNAARDADSSLKYDDLLGANGSASILED